MKDNIKKSLLVIVCMLSCTSVFAYDFKVGGIYYSIVSLPDLTCEVSSGDNKYKGQVTIPATVTYKNRTLTVTEIRSNAFEGCSGLTSVSIPNSVTSIGNGAFKIEAAVPIQVSVPALCLVHPILESNLSMY